MKTIKIEPIPAVIFAPGTPGGICKSCKHQTCALLEAMASNYCLECAKVLGYGIPFFELDIAGIVGFVHAKCAR